MKIDIASLREPAPGHFHTIFGSPEYTGWMDESLSWKETCYIGDWSFLWGRRYRGRDALRLFSDISVNSMRSFEIGQSKHAIHCNARGKVIHEGILSRFGDEDLICFGRGVFLASYVADKGEYEVDIEDLDWANYQVQGPNALYVLERACGESLRDVGFMRSKMVRIADHEVVALRQGMSGELGFELQMPKEHGPSIYQAILDVGRDYGIRRMGGRVALINHLEACYPTTNHDYLPAIFDNDMEEYRDVLARGMPQLYSLMHRIEGSFESDDIRDWYRSPVELGWARNIKFDHEFTGRAALETEIQRPKRTIVTLVWNSEDVQDVYNSLFRKAEEPYRFMEMPRENRGVTLADRVEHDGELVGVSTSRGYSLYFREMISLCTIDLAYREPGTAVVVIWGEPGQRQKMIRATVAPAPYKPHRGRVDLRSLPLDARGVRDA
jgi:vanillate/3-O-methylgallate O-demethylase